MCLTRWQSANPKALSVEQRYNDKAMGRKTSKDPTPKRSNVEDCKIEGLGGSKREQWTAASVE